MVTDHIRQAKTHLKEYYGEAEGEKYMARLAAGASAHALLAIHDLLADALASPETALRASESDAEPVEAPEDPPTPESPREDDSDQALANALLLASEASRGLDGRWVDVDWHALARAARKHIVAEWNRVDMDVDSAQQDAIAAHERAEKAESEADRLRHQRDIAQRNQAAADSAARSYRDSAEALQAERDIARENQAAADVALGDALEAERDWRAKHAALRADVEFEAVNHGTSSPRRCLNRILDTDDARDPSGDHHEVGSKCQRDHCEEMHEPDTDTVTLRRDDVEALLNHGVLSPTQRADAVRRAREALGWGGSDE